MGRRRVASKSEFWRTRRGEKQGKSVKRASSVAAAAGQEKEYTRKGVDAQCDPDRSLSFGAEIYSVFGLQEILFLWTVRKGRQVQICLCVSEKQNWRTYRYVGLFLEELIFSHSLCWCVLRCAFGAGGVTLFLAINISAVYPQRRTWPASNVEATPQQELFPDLFKLPPWSWWVWWWPHRRKKRFPRLFQPRLEHAQQTTTHSMCEQEHGSTQRGGRPNGRYVVAQRRYEICLVSALDYYETLD